MMMVISIRPRKDILTCESDILTPRNVGMYLYMRCPKLVPSPHTRKKVSSLHVNFGLFRLAREGEVKLGNYIFLLHFVHLIAVDEILVVPTAAKVQV